MNWDGYYINDYEKWHYFAQRPRLYKYRKVKAWSCIAIPIIGIILTYLMFDDMGLSIF